MSSPVFKEVRYDLNILVNYIELGEIGLPDLQRPFVWKNVTDAGLSHLSGLPNLTELDLEGCEGLTDAGVSHLSGLTSLTTLNLDGLYRITDAGLSHLSGLTNLTSLDLDDCSKLTESAVDELKEALPKCEISWEVVEESSSVLESSSEEDEDYDYDDE